MEEHLVVLGLSDRCRDVNDQTLALWIVLTLTLPKQFLGVLEVPHRSAGPEVRLGSGV
jgi:hypothetical protein